MLLQLAIENFAIIERLVVPFDPGLTVLTGETGAGKSILIDALQAALGARTPVDMVRSGARVATVEAIFDFPLDDESGPLSLLAEYGIEPDEQLILRREISTTGRSVARINGHALPIASLQSIGALLVDIHGQSEHLSILRRDRQLDVLDRFGELTDLRNRVSAAMSEWTGIARELQALVTGRRETEQRLDLLRFQVEEIESAKLTADEERDLEADRARLANAERLAYLADSAHECLAGENGGAIEALRDALAATRELGSIDTDRSDLNARLEAARYELEDVGEELRRYRDQVENDPDRLRAIEERLDLLTRLRRKYGATLEDVIAFGEQARASLFDAENLDDRITELQSGAEQAEREAGDLIGQLSIARGKAAQELARAMRAALTGLGLNGTGFEARLTQTESAEGLNVPALDGRYVATGAGVDAITFLVSFNPGEPLRPIDRVASGGETSRFLLALKSVLATADPVPTLVFDEVDVGVGARHGRSVGERLRDLAHGHQVLSITHLPPVAALADHHLTVRKTVTGERTTMIVQVLEGAERVSEIAAMMSGSESETARKNARELLELAHRS